MAPPNKVVTEMSDYRYIMLIERVGIEESCHIYSDMKYGVEETIEVLFKVVLTLFLFG